MKKILMGLLCSALLVSFCSCNNDTGKDSSDTTTTTAPTVTETPYDKEEYLSHIKENAPGFYDFSLAMGSVPHTFTYALIDPKTFGEVYVNTYTIDENYDCVSVYEMNGKIDREVWIGKMYYYFADDKKVYTKSESTDKEYEEDIAGIKKSYESPGFYKESFKITKGTAELNGEAFTTDTISDSRTTMTLYYDKSGKLVYMSNGTQLRKIISFSLEADKSLFDIPDDFRLVTAEEMDEILSED